MVVLHYTGMVTCTAALDRLCDPEPPEGLSPVSAHYLISERGEVWQLVAEADRAWHAGAGAWGDVGDVNSHSIGIELANTGAHPFSEPQMAALEAVLAGVLDRWSIPAERVIGHSDMAPHRKADPGPRFDWRRLAWRGLSVWPEAVAGCDTRQFFEDLERIGYRVPEGAGDAEALMLWAFRLRFRPWAAGRDGVDGVDAALAADLARRFGVV
jgi:N-acetylmuramoyl-L-alanine amidase